MSAKTFTICGVHELGQFHQKGFSHVLTLLDPGPFDPEDFQHFRPHRRTVFRFHDIVEQIPGRAGPTETEMDDILAFGKQLAEDKAEHVLVHCFAGVSRSTAATLTLLMQSGRKVDEAYEYLYSIRPRSWPNAVMVGLADRKLELGGRLRAALADYQTHVLAHHPEVAEIIIDAGRAHELPPAFRP